MPALTDLTVIEAVRLLQEGQVSSRELTTACLERIDHLEPALHAFITFTPDLALAQADAADQYYAGLETQPPKPPSAAARPAYGH